MYPQIEWGDYPQVEGAYDPQFEGEIEGAEYPPHCVDEGDEYPQIEGGSRLQSALMIGELQHSCAACLCLVCW